MDHRSQWAGKLIDCFGFHAVSAIISQPYNGGDYQVNARLWNVEVSLVALTSLLFYEIQRNGLLRAKGVVVLDTGHYWKFHPTDIGRKMFLDIYSLKRNILWKSILNKCMLGMTLWTIYVYSFFRETISWGSNRVYS